MLLPVIMSLNIKKEEVDRLARELAKRTGKTITDALEDVLRDELSRLTARESGRKNRSIRERLLAVRDALKQLPVRDPRTADEILGYGSDGLPH